MKPVYKKVKVWMPQCPICGEMLSGNNSIVLPYRCKCGTWKNSWLDPFDYKIEPTPNQPQDE